MDLGSNGGKRCLPRRHTPAPGRSRPRVRVEPRGPGAGPGPAGAGGGGRGAGASGPSPAESPWGALAASAVDLGSVGGGPCPGSAPAPGGPAGREGPPQRCRPPGEGDPGPPPAAAGTARESRGRSRPPLPRPAAPARLRPASPSGPRPPRAAAAPAPGSPTARGPRPGPHAAVVAPRWFPRAVLVCVSPSPCPPAPQPGTRPRACPAWVTAGGGAIPSSGARAGGSGGRGLSPLRPHAWLWGSAEPRSSAPAMGQRQRLQPGSSRPHGAPGRRQCEGARRRDRASHLRRGHRQPRWGANTRFPGLQHPRAHGDGSRSAPRRCRGRCPGSPRAAERGGGRWHRRPVKTIRPPFPRPPAGPPGLPSARHLPGSGVRAAAPTPIHEPRRDRP